MCKKFTLLCFACTILVAAGCGMRGNKIMDV